MLPAGKILSAGISLTRDAKADMYDDYDDDTDLNRKGMVFNIQKYSVHDGPGIRTIVFLKGCGLRCRWCSNPESQNGRPELAWNSGRCIGLSKCGHCLEVCPNGALKAGKDDKPALDRTLCSDCQFHCADSCPSQGFIVYGKERTVKDVLDHVEQDMAFYSRSGGGMTLSGGEPLLQKDFSVALLRQGRKRRMKTAIETCGMVPQENIQEAAPYLSYALFDIKHMDAPTHKEHTGAANNQILTNFDFLAKNFGNLPILARTPIIPGVNDNIDVISQIAEFLKPYKNARYELLPYHRLGTQKYHFLHRDPPMGDVVLDKKIMPKLQQAAQKILGDRVQIPH